MDDEDLASMKEDRRLENTDTFRSGAFAGERAPGDRWVRRTPPRCRTLTA